MLFPRVTNATRRVFLALVAAAGLLAACGTNAGDGDARASRELTNAFGTVHIPANPVRIVTTTDQNALLPLLELGGEAVGSAWARTQVVLDMVEQHLLADTLVSTGVNK